MALTELQLPAKQNFYNHMQSAASRMDNMMRTWENLAEFVGFIEAADLDAMGVATGQVRTDLTNFRTVMNELVAFFRGESTTQTQVPADVVDKVRTMS